ncbi:MAG: DUF4124 domain-containing protein [bacterium]|nr:DUF4124 domain-containing protein [bacterium]
MNKLVLCGILTLFFCTSYAQIYKWTDEQGVVHFSDHPHQGSEKIKIPEVQAYSPPSPLKTEIPPIEPSSEKKDSAYQSITITQPLNESTIRNNDGYVAAAVQVLPDLIKGDNLQLLFDGAPMGEPQPNVLFQLNGIFRGKHTIAVKIVDEKGETIMTSDTITFYMFRPRVGMVK